MLAAVQRGAARSLAALFAAAALAFAVHAGAVLALGLAWHRWAPRLAAVLRLARDHRTRHPLADHFAARLLLRFLLPRRLPPLGRPPMSVVALADRLRRSNAPNPSQQLVLPGARQYGAEIDSCGHLVVLSSRLEGERRRTPPRHAFAEQPSGLPMLELISAGPWVASFWLRRSVCCIVWRCWLRRRRGREPRSALELGWKRRPERRRRLDCPRVRGLGCGWPGPRRWRLQRRRRSARRWREPEVIDWAVLRRCWGRLGRTPAAGGENHQCCQQPRRVAAPWRLQHT